MIENARFDLAHKMGIYDREHTAEKITRVKTHGGITVFSGAQDSVPGMNWHLIRVKIIFPPIKLNICITVIQENDVLELPSPGKTEFHPRLLLAAYDLQCPASSRENTQGVKSLLKLLPVHSAASTPDLLLQTLMP